MFSYITKKIRYSKLKSKNQQSQNNSQSNASNKPENELISSDLKKNLEVIKTTLNNSSDMVIHEFNFGQERKAEGALIYIDSLVNKDMIHENILKPLMYDTLRLNQNNNLDFTDINYIKNSLLSISDNQKVLLLNDLLDCILTGSTILLVNNSKEALSINAKKWEARSVQEPRTESVVRGPREGFTENIKVNLALLRRKIKDFDLCFENHKIGEKSKTDVCIVYLKSIANAKVIDEIRLRLSRIKIDAILESGYIEQYIEDNPYSIFSTIGNSEKPDRVAAKILEGRVAIVVDGSPFVLTVPLLFVESFQSAEDYYSRPYFSTIVRLLRFLSFSISIFAPAVYVALTVFHQELVPTQLLITIVAGHQPVPFSSSFEAALMLITFDILREAGIRLPRPVGSAISIVGALVLGQAAVSAGLIGPIVVILVSLTAIASFVVPAQTDSGSILRYFFLFLAGISGGFGIIMGIVVILIHLASLRSFGTPYLWPIAPLDISGMKDTFIRMPLWTMITRPKAITWQGSTRQSPDLVPSTKKKNKSNYKN